MMSIRSQIRGTAAAVLLGVLSLFPPTGAHAEITKSADNGFSIEHRLSLPVPPEEAYDAMTGDISGWWDHSFSDNPKAFYIEARPGGGFYEIFDDSGDGVLHATVIYAHRGKLLRYEGPLGLSGTALTFVVSYAYEARGQETMVTVTVDASGNIKAGWAEAVDGVWRHFLVEQLEPYVTSGKHRQKQSRTAK